MGMKENELPKTVKDEITDDGMPFFELFGQDEKYHVEKKLGKGGMGEVLSVVDKNIQRKVALKLIIRDKASDASSMSRFIEEVQITGQLEHPNIVPTYELGKTKDGKIYYTMKLVKGVTLEAIIDSLKEKKSTHSIQQYSSNRLLQIFIQACNGIAFAASKGVVHRDLKPENIMVGEFGEVLIMDWGLAKVLGKSERKGGVAKVEGVRESGMVTKTMDGTVMGTPAYMPPEQAAGEVSEIDARSDVYGLGTILYQILTFTPPYVNKDIDKVLEAVVNKPVTPPRKRNPVNHIPKELEAVCLKAMAKNKSKRYASAQLLAADIQSYLEGKSVSALPDALLVRAVKWVKRNKILSGSIAAIVLVTAGLYGGLTYLQYSQKQAEIRNNLSEAEEFVSQNDYEKALESYNKALGLDPDNVFATIGAGDCKEKLSSLAEEEKKHAVESERSKKISELLAPARAFKEAGDKLLQEEIKPIETILFKTFTAEEGHKIDHGKYYKQWLEKQEIIKEKYDKAIQNYQSVYQLNRDNETVNKDLSGIYRIYFDWAEKVNDYKLAEIYGQLLALYDRKGIHADYLKGAGRLKITSNPPGAEVYLFSLKATADKRLSPEGFNTVEMALQDLSKVQSLKLGQTPLDWKDLEMGSYLAVLHKDGYADTRYPVFIERKESEIADVRLLKESEIPEGMVYVPAGEFFPLLNLNAKVILPGFLISKYEVAYGEYVEFMNNSDKKGSEEMIDYCKRMKIDSFVVDAEGKYALRNSVLERIPVAYLVPSQAMVYAMWKSDKKGGKYRLPTMDEWIKAARGADKRLYPWGNVANSIFANISEGAKETYPEFAGSFRMDCSIYGVYDMAGNLSEWTSDYKTTSGQKYHYVKGGRINWEIKNCGIDNTQLYQDAFHTFEVGFRLVKEIE